MPTIDIPLDENGNPVPVTQTTIDGKLVEVTVQALPDKYDQQIADLELKKTQLLQQYQGPLKILEVIDKKLEQVKAQKAAL